MARAPAAPPTGTPAPPADGFQERELKLRLRAQDLPALRARLDRLAPARVEQVDSIYFDTPDRRLARARAALRLRAVVRDGRRRWVQTLKTDDGMAAFSQRGEWETALPAARLDLDRFAATPLPGLLAGTPGAAAPARARPPAGLHAVFRTRFARTVWDVHLDGLHVEAVIDEGSIEAGGRTQAILEAELELRAGPAAAVWTLARRLAGADGRKRRADLSLLPYGESKAARGYRLAFGAPAAGPDWTAPAFRPAVRVGEAARMLVAEEMHRVLDFAVATGAGRREDERLHQARVALRRLRSALDVLGAPLPAWLERDLKSWAQRLGAVRDWDVFCSQLLPAMAGAAADGPDRAWSRLAAAAERRRERAHARLRQQIDAPAFAHFALRALQWSSTAPHPGGKRLAQRAPTVLRRQRNRLAADARGFAAQPPARQHRVRRRAKAVRYALVVFAQFLPRRTLRAVIRRLVRFQDAAGRVQDAALARTLARRLTRSARLRARIDAWAQSGAQAAASRAQRLALRISAPS